MRIHITKTDPRFAATELRELFRKFSGSWVVHGYAAEGFVAGRLGTREGDALLKYGTDESFAGVYDTARLPSEKQIAADLRAASAEYRNVYGESYDREGRNIIDRRGSSKHTTFIPLTDIAEKSLQKTGARNAMDLAVDIRCSRSAAETALKKLLDANRVKVVGTIPSKSPRGGVPSRVFGVTA